MKKRYEILNGDFKGLVRMTYKGEWIRQRFVKSRCLI